MLSVREFYALRRWRDEWNVLRADGSRHRGHDIAAAEHEDIPVLRAGRVVARARSSVLGDYVVVTAGGLGYDFYCHLRSPDRPALSAELAAGSKAGSAAGRGDYHGSAWSGPHLHFGCGPALNSVRSGPTFDATAIIRSVLGTTPAGTPTTPIEEEDDMAKDARMIHEITADGKVGRRALLVPGTAWFVAWTESGATYANRFAAGFETGSSMEVTSSLYNAFANSAKASGDLQG